MREKSEILLRKRRGIYFIAFHYLKKTGQMYFDPKSVTNDLVDVVSYYNNFTSKFGIKIVYKNKILNELKYQINYVWFC